MQSEGPCFRQWPDERDHAVAVPSTNARAPSKSWRVSPPARSSHSSTCKFGIPYRPIRNKRDPIQRPVCGCITGL